MHPTARAMLVHVCSGPAQNWRAYGVCKSYESGTRANETSGNGVDLLLCSSAGAVTVCPDLLCSKATTHARADNLVLGVCRKVEQVSEEVYTIRTSLDRFGNR